jgi:hypothetical protein
MVDRVLHEGGVSKVNTQGMREIRTAGVTVLGTVKELDGGKEIVYSKLSTAAGSAAIGCGFIMIGPAAVANHGRRAVTLTASIGAKEVVLTIGATSASKDEYADGYLIVECGTGTGYSYKILGHAAWAASNTAARVILKDELEIAATTATLCTLIKNPYKDIITKADSAAIAGKPAGVMLFSAALTDGGFLWLGKKGIFAARPEGSIVAGGPVSCGSAAGTVGPLAAATEVQVGICVNTGSVTGPGTILVNFNL